MKHVLVAIDGSDRSDKTLDAAIALAKAEGTALGIVYVADRHVLSQSEEHLADTEFAESLKKYGFEKPAETNVDALRSQLENFLREHYNRGAVIKELVGNKTLDYGEDRALRAGVTGVRKTLRTGDPATQIIEAAKAAKADVIVVGSRGHGEIASLLLGSVSHKLVNASPVSVYVVK